MCHDECMCSVVADLNPHILPMRDGESTFHVDITVQVIDSSACIDFFPHDNNIAFLVILYISRSSLSFLGPRTNTRQQSSLPPIKRTCQNLNGNSQPNAAFSLTTTTPNAGTLEPRLDSALAFSRGSTLPTTVSGLGNLANHVRISHKLSGAASDTMLRL
jgi:hypothetical protein